MIELTLPMPPSINATYKRGRGHHIYKSKEATEWEQEALTLLLTHKHKMNNEAKIEVVMYLYFKRESDVDSRTKITLDLLQKAGIYKNDSQVYNLLIFKNFDKENPRVELRVSET